MARRLWPELRICFDETYYLQRYPDVAHSGIDPLAHFLLYGGPEARMPGPWFDSRYYLEENPDVADAKANPLLHYLRYGWKEGRAPNPLFDAVFYRQNAAIPDSDRRNVFLKFVTRWKRGTRPRSALPFTLPPESYQVATVQNPENNRVDIVIPVYSGLVETRRCLESVRSANCRTPHRVVLVDDAIPDPALRDYLREIAETEDWLLIENRENAGFVESVNRGLAVSGDRDVILLNNDTEVANDWLDRLSAAVRREDHVGTATPFSNHATLASYPKAGQRNPLPAGVTTGELDNLFNKVNAGWAVEIPTAVGFCMYIRRECLHDTGSFRAEIFGRGYGEENDFCRRSATLGWKHVLATDVFVYHEGETSFGQEAEARRKSALEKLKGLYPDYVRRLGEHDRRDPLKPYRVAVSAERMRQAGQPVILSVTHNLGGGVAQYVDELNRTLAGRARMLSLTPTDSGAVFVRNLDPADDFKIAFDPEQDHREMVELLRRCGVSRIHVQHLAGHTIDVAGLAQELGAKLDISVHDYFFLCQRFTLTDAEGRYCGEHHEGVHERCAECRGRAERYASLVNVADRVIAPSRDTAERMRRAFPLAKIIAAAHPLPPKVAVARPFRIPGPDTPLTIGVLGAMTPHKGIDRLRACADQARRTGAPIRFVLIGYVAGGGGGEFVKTGPYNNDTLPGLLREHAIDVVWFPGQFPETFSYTLSTCIVTGLPVIAPDLGAFTERLAGREWSWIVPYDLDSDKLVAFFTRIRREHFLRGMSPAVFTFEGVAAEQDFYPRCYLSGGGIEEGR